MCNAGDIIIIIDNPIVRGTSIGRHSFVVISSESGQIQGLDYDIICNVMSSIKSEAQKTKKLNYPGNFYISHNDSNCERNNKDGFIKAEQLYYFQIDELQYQIIGALNLETFNLLLEFIEDLNVPIQNIIDNLKQPLDS